MHSKVNWEFIRDKVIRILAEAFSIQKSNISAKVDIWFETFKGENQQDIERAVKAIIAHRTRKEGFPAPGDLNPFLVRTKRANDNKLKECGLCHAGWVALEHPKTHDCRIGLCGCERGQREREHNPKAPHYMDLKIKGYITRREMNERRAKERGMPEDIEGRKRWLRKKLGLAAGGASLEADNQGEYERKEREAIQSENDFVEDKK